MSSRVANRPQEMSESTVEALKDLVKGLNDSVLYHSEAAERINDDYASQVLTAVANERRKICQQITTYINLSGELAPVDGTFFGALRNIWTAFRAALNSGETTVVLIEAERAEDVIVNKFKSILPEIAGNPVNDRLLQHFELVKSGHDRILTLRNYFQAK